MKIYGNQELIKNLVIINELKDKFIEDLNSLNTEYSPLFFGLKKDRENLLYVIGVVGILIVIATFLSFLGPSTIGYIVYLFHAILWTVLIISLVKLKKVNQNYKKIKEEWELRHTKVCQYKDEANKIYDISKDEVFKVIAYNTNKEDLDNKINTMTNNQYQKHYDKLIEDTKKIIFQSIGNSATSEDIVKYYEEWAKKFIGDETQDYQEFLENRKRKAALRSKETHDS